MSVQCSIAGKKSKSPAAATAYVSTPAASEKEVEPDMENEKIKRSIIDNFIDIFRYLISRSIKLILELT